MAPQIYKMTLLPRTGPAISDLDYFILAGGSDRRAYSVLSRVDVSTSSQTKVILVNFRERLENKPSSDPIFSYKRLRISRLQEVECEIKDPSSSLHHLQTNTFLKTARVGVDISCFTKPYFYFLLKLLNERFGVRKVHAYYTEPKSYNFSRGLFTAFRSSTGPLSIIEIPGYPGREKRDSERKLIILLGFDPDLSREITDDVSPSETIVVNGFPSYSPKFKDISLIANEKLVSAQNIRIEYARANHPFEVYNLLQSIKSESGRSHGKKDAFMNIAPIGTKPMALGACLFALHNPDVRIIYPLPERYEDKYSDEKWNSWLYELPLSP